MPFSQSSQLSTIVGFFESRRPRSMLDVGTGLGQYGLLLRNNLEKTGLFVIEGACGRQARKGEWRVRIDGIEGFEVYRTAVHDDAHNVVFWGEALSELQRLPSRGYEAVMAVDILEHFDQPRGIRFLEELKRVASGVRARACTQGFPCTDRRSRPTRLKTTARSGQRRSWQRQALTTFS